MNAAPGAAASQFRPLLIEKRARRKQSAGSLSAEYLNGLLAEVDAALAKIDAGTSGRCETCHDPIEPDRLQATPMTRFRLDHLTGEERRAPEQDLELASRIRGPRGRRLP
jgi:sigma-B regulation protein RsbU (phosphoserine phosphatase)